MSSAEGWIGVDLDGTLAHHEPGNFKAGIIGAPIPKMVARVQQWLARGKEVRVFTARAHLSTPATGLTIRAWCREHIGQELMVTCVKDFNMVELWDDRAVQVVTNTGMTIDEYWST